MPSSGTTSRRRTRPPQRTCDPAHGAAASSGDRRRADRDEARTVDAATAAATTATRLPSTRYRSQRCRTADHGAEDDAGDAERPPRRQAASSTERRPPARHDAERRSRRRPEPHERAEGDDLGLTATSGAGRSRPATRSSGRPRCSTTAPSASRPTASAHAVASNGARRRRRARSSTTNAPTDELGEHEHHGQRRVGVRRPRRRTRGRRLACRPSSCGTSWSATVIDDGGAPGTSVASPCVAAIDGGDVDDRDGDRPVRARLHARRRLALGQAVAAHVALAHDAEALVERRHLVGTGQRAVAAADALVVEVRDDPGDGILLVRVDRAAVQAGRVDAVVAARR